MFKHFQIILRLAQIWLELKYYIPPFYLYEETWMMNTFYDTFFLLIPFSWQKSNFLEKILKITPKNPKELNFKSCQIIDKRINDVQWCETVAECGGDGGEDI